VSKNDGAEFVHLRTMKNFTNIIFAISLAGFLALNINAKGPDNTIVNNSNINHQDLPEGITINHINGGAVSYYILINFFINNDLYGGFNFGTLMPEIDFPWRSHYQPIGSSYPFGLKGGEIKMVARISKTELRRRRVLYYAAKRRCDSLEDKRKASMNIIKTGKKERIQVDKETNDKVVVTVKLTDAQIADEKRILAELVLELEKAEDNLKLRDFGFSKAVKNQTDDILTKTQAYRERKDEEKLNTVKALMNSAIRNGSMQQVLDLQKLSGDGSKIKAVKAEMMKIIRKENKNGYPIRNLSFKTVEIIMAGLLNWDTENSDQPFDVS